MKLFRHHFEQFAFAHETHLDDGTVEPQTLGLLQGERFAQLLASKQAFFHQNIRYYHTGTSCGLHGLWVPVTIGTRLGYAAKSNLTAHIGPTTDRRSNPRVVQGNWF